MHVGRARLAPHARGLGQRRRGGSSEGRTAAEGYAPSGLVQNHVKFASKAGDAIIFDIATFHTGQPNTSALDRECTILMYTNARAAASYKERRGSLSPGLLERLEAAGTLSSPGRRKLLGMPHSVEK